MIAIFDSSTATDERIILALLTLTHYASAQVIPTTRTTKWLKAGHQGAYLKNIQHLDITNFGGNGNTSIGNEAGCINTTGNGNTIVGCNENLIKPNLENTTANGANEKAAATCTMILGDNHVLVCIGLSGNKPEPRSKLKINSSESNSIGLLFTNLSINPTASQTNDTKFFQWTKMKM